MGKHGHAEVTPLHSDTERRHQGVALTTPWEPIVSTGRPRGAARAGAGRVPGGRVYAFSTAAVTRGRTLTQCVTSPLWTSEIQTGAAIRCGQHWTLWSRGSRPGLLRLLEAPALLGWRLCPCAQHVPGVTSPSDPPAPPPPARSGPGMLWALPQQPGASPQLEVLNFITSAESPCHEGPRLRPWASAGPFR